MFTTMFHHLIVLSFCFLCVLSVENNFDKPNLAYKIGSSVTIKCSSNLEIDYVFVLWIIQKTGVIIGPEHDFDHTKYDYHPINGNLTIRCVLIENNFDNTLVYKIGSSVTIKCSNNLDYDHVFMFWHLPKTHIVIGPRNDFDHTKYDYDAVNGNLKIRNLSADDAGTYSCVSVSITFRDNKIRSAYLEVIKDDTNDTENTTVDTNNAEDTKYDTNNTEDTEDDTFFQSTLIICIFVFFLLLLVCIYLGLCIRRKCRGIDFDVESGGSPKVIYNPTTTTFKSENEKLYGNNNSWHDEEETNVPEEKERMYKEEHVDNVD